MPRPTPRPRLRQLAACTLLALGAATAQAQGLVQLYESARDYDASLQAARAQLQADEARADQARAGLLPQLALQAGGQRNWNENSVLGQRGSRSFNTLNATLVGSQPLYAPARRLAREQGELAAELSQVQLEGTGQELIVRVAQAYFEVLAAEDTLASVRALKLAVQQQLEAARRNFEVGNATITDSREAEARFDLATAQEIATENDLQVRRLALDQLVGLSGTRPHRLSEPIVLPALQADQLQTWIHRALDQHPAIRQARMGLELARLEADKARAGHRPTVDLQASLGQTRYPDGNPGMAAAPRASSRTTSAAVGVMLNWPLYTGGAVEGQVREALALQDKAQADLDSLERNISQATRSAFYGVLSGLGQVHALEAAEQSSLTALQANQLGYQVGVRINIDVLNAQSQLYQTQADLARARYNVLLGQLQLRQAAGVLTPEDLQAIEPLLAPGA